jgi:hypothetical protein
MAFHICQHRAGEGEQASHGFGDFAGRRRLAMGGRLPPVA